MRRSARRVSFSMSLLTSLLTNVPKNGFLQRGKSPLLASRSAEVRKVLRALDRAEQFIAKSPAEAKQMVIARTAVDAALLDTIFPSFTYRLSLNQSLISAMEGEGRWSIREGHASAKTVPNYLKLVDDGPLRSAVPSAFPR